MKRYATIMAAVFFLLAAAAPANSAGRGGRPEERSAAQGQPARDGSQPCTNSEEHAGHGPASIIVDTDMGLDDVRAVFALLADGSIEIECFVTVEGSASIGKGLDNLLGLLESVHVGGVPVIGGLPATGSDPPPWRPIADALGGIPFPPPRALSPVTGGVHALERILDTHDGKIDYLALGPLGNLAALITEDDGRIRHPGTVWIPARIEGDSIECWNLAYDERSAGVVLGGARDVIIIDMTPARELDAPRILETVEGEAPAARWIRSLTDDPAAGAHLSLFDELAAILAASPDLRTIAEKRYRIDVRDGRHMLRENGNGNVRIASMNTPAALVDRLKSLWEERIPEDHRHAPPDTDVESVEHLIKTFHGHLGPYVVLGYRMGRIALETLGSGGHFGISVDVHSVLEPPASCLIDGVQLGSGCTLGKRNIELFESAGPAMAIFRSEDGGAVAIRLRPELPALISELIKEKGVEATGELFMTKDPGEIFIIEQAHRRER